MDRVKKLARTMVNINIFFGLNRVKFALYGNLIFDDTTHADRVELRLIRGPIAPHVLLRTRQGQGDCNLRRCLPTATPPLSGEHESIQ